MSRLFRNAGVVGGAVVCIFGLAAATQFYLDLLPPATHLTQTSADVSMPTVLRYQEGVHYSTLKKPFKTDGPELREIFSYACPHCDVMRAVVHKVTQSGLAVYENPMPFMPALKPDVAELLAAGLVAARSCNASGAYNDKIFDMIHRQHRREFLRSEVASVLMAICQIPETRADELLSAAFQSTTLQLDVDVARQLLITDKAIRGVPSFIVNGTYVINLHALSKTELAEDIVEITKFLQEKHYVPSAL